MNLKQLFLTKNDCYISGQKHTVKGIVVHSTGANNPNLKRYVGPDDGLLGVNTNGNHWNSAKPGGKQICVHAFIGKLADGNIATYQTLPWDIVSWHSGAGNAATAKKNGFSGNNANFLGYVGFEICEDGLTDATYFNAVYKEAVELCAYLCKQYGLKPESPVLICHSEGNKLGIASNHADVMHWFPKHNKSMDTFRADVANLLSDGGAVIPSTTTPEKYADIMYRVRKTWSDSASQKGAYKVLDNAKKCAEENPGYSVFDESGSAVYAGKETAPTYEIHTVVKGDSLWKISADKLGNGARYAEIRLLNGMTSNVIYAGQKLKIPKK
ncbi:hypothetical protein FACS1894105_10800 [Clostridia bacterium]|nr:hypothetical protein FACS1894105_10800 [Clostridia bacterium]